MTFSSVFGFIYALTKAIPVLDKAVRGFIAFYAIKQVEWYRKELHEAIKKAIGDGATKPIEDAIGSPRAGKPSGNDGVEYSDPDSPK